jgi:hypothetical protein
MNIIFYSLFINQGEVALKPIISQQIQGSFIATIESQKRQIIC